MAAGAIRARSWLAPIMVADVAGYSRLMHEDEEGTLARVTALLTETTEAIHEPPDAQSGPCCSFRSAPAAVIRSAPC